MTETVSAPFIEGVKSERDSKLSERKRILGNFKKAIASQASQGGSSIAFPLNECYAYIRGPYVDAQDPSFSDFNTHLLYLTHDLLAEGFKVSALFTYTLNLVVEW